MADPVVYEAIIPYADLEFAEAYMGERVETDNWDVADDNAKLKALKAATRYIDTLPFVGSKTDWEQKREFPRDGDEEIPYEVAEACCEAALAMIAGNTLENLQATNTKSSESTGDASASYKQGASLLDQNDGLISPMVLRLLAEWLDASDSFKIDRVG